jgi:hypothetical protein
MKVKNVQSTGSFDFNDKTFYSFEYEFEDGTSGIANHLSQASPFKSGDEVLVEENGVSPRGDRKIKVKRPESGSYTPQNSTNSSPKVDSSTQDQIMRQTALKCASHFYHQQTAVSENTVIFTAQRWYEWCKTGNPVLSETK